MDAGPADSAPRDASPLDSMPPEGDAAGPDPCTEDGAVFRVDETDEPTSAESIQIAIDAAHDLLVVWGENGTVVGRVCRAGEGWQPIEVIGDGGQPKLAANASGQAVVAFDHGAGYVGTAMASRYDPARGWDLPVLIGSWFRSRVAIDAHGNAVTGGIVADDLTCNPWHFAVKRFETETGWRDSEIPFADLVRPTAADVAAVGDPGSFLAVISNEEACDFGDSVLWSSRFSPETGWESPVRVSGDDGVSSSHRLGLDAVGNAVAVWRSGAEGSLYAARFDFEDGWQAPGPIDATPTTGQIDLSVSSDGRAMVVWTDGRHVWSAGSDPVLGWQAAVEIGEGPLMDGALIDAGGAIVVWETFGDQIWARRQDTEGRWADPILVAEGFEVTGPILSVSPDGYAAIAWGFSTRHVAVLRP